MPACRLPGKGGGGSSRGGILAGSCGGGATCLARLGVGGGLPHVSTGVGPGRENFLSLPGGKGGGAANRNKYII